MVFWTIGRWALNYSPLPEVGAKPKKVENHWSRYIIMSQHSISRFADETSSALYHQMADVGFAFVF